MSSARILTTASSTVVRLLRSRRSWAENVLTRCLNQAFFLLASLALAASAHASYGQMRLDGIELFLACALIIVYGLMVDVALIARIFQYRAALAVGCVLALAITSFLLVQAAPPSERAGFFKVYAGGWEQVVLLATSAVFLPFILIAPFAQYLAMREGRRWPVGITAGMVLQLALLPGFLVLANMEDHFWKREYAAGQAAGRELRAGGLGGIRELLEQRRERIWGTGWLYPWREKAPSRYAYSRSAWKSGLAKSVDDSALIAADDSLGEPDRAALRTLMERDFAGYAVPNIRVKLIWDGLEPGAFSRQLAPLGLNEPGVISEELIPVLLERLEKYGPVRLCPDGRMLDADRLLLNQLILAKVRAYGEAKERELRSEQEAKKLEIEMSEAPFPYSLLWKAANALGNEYGGQPVGVPDWSGYPHRVERLCRGPE